MIETTYKIPITDGFSPSPSVASFQRYILATHNKVQFPNYRAAFKLNELRERTLLHHLDLHGFAMIWQSFEEEMERLFTLKQLVPSEALLFSSSFTERQEAELSYSNVNLFLRKVYKHIQGRSLQELNYVEAKQFLFDFLIYCFDRPVEHSIRANSLQTLMVLLSANKLVDRTRYFCRSLSTPDGRILLDVLPFFLCDLFQILDGLGEGPSFGSSLADIEKFRLQCLGRLALHAKCADREWISQNEFLSLIIHEPVPDCLEWLSVWERVDTCKKDRHKIKCSGCRQTPIVGLRFKCSNCRNYNLCQNCFMVRRTTANHRPNHTMREKQAKKGTKNTLINSKLICTTSSLDEANHKQRTVTENPQPHVRTPIIGPTLSRTVSRSGSLTPSSSQFSVHSLPNSTLTNTSSRRANRDYSNFGILDSEYMSGGMQTNLDDVVTCSPDWELKQSVTIPPTIEEGDSSSPTGISDSSTRTSANEFAFDAIVKDLESWLDEISNDSPLLEEPPACPLRLRKEAKINYIPCSDEHLPKLSDLLITEPIHSSSPKRKVFTSLSPFLRINTSSEDSCDINIPSPPPRSAKTRLSDSQEYNVQTDTPPIQYSTVRRDSGKFIIQVNKQKRSKSSSGSDDQEVPDTRIRPSPAKVYRSMSLGRSGSIDPTHKTMIRFHQSIFDSTSTGKGVFRPEATEDKHNIEELYTEEAKDRVTTKIISTKSRSKPELSDRTRELTSPLAIRLLAYGLEKEPSKSNSHDGLSRSSSAHLYEHHKIKLTNTDAYSISRSHIRQTSPMEQRRSLGYVGSAVLKKPSERSLSSSLSSLSMDMSIASSTSTDRRLCDTPQSEGVGRGKYVSLSGSNSAYRLSQIKTEQSAESDSNTMPKRQKQNNHLSDSNLNRLSTITYKQKSLSGQNLAQQSTTTVGKGLQGRIDALLNVAKKHQQPEPVSTRSDSPVLQNLREIENLRKSAEQPL
ncbi:hypothetical protein LOD99_3692 [Oopsacas minuta]|uniref:ZZ-type domain-containing protein n=1 Tax=Oopsacas minuta TaxID=111878 RepID=A0AAV7JXG6_9METZ|nr:hypothetical protein LOD99_3692 [Oopsacas minuta]